MFLLLDTKFSCKRVLHAFYFAHRRTSCTNPQLSPYLFTLLAFTLDKKKHLNENQLLDALDAFYTPWPRKPRQLDREGRCPWGVRDLTATLKYILQGLNPVMSTFFTGFTTTLILTKHPAAQKLTTANITHGIGQLIHVTMLKIKIQIILLPQNFAAK